MKKRLLVLTLVLLFALLTFASNAQAAESGTLGPVSGGVSWSYAGDTLTLSGGSLGATQRNANLWSVTNPLPATVTKVNITGPITGTGTSFANLFANCYYIEEITGLSYLNTSNATSLANMFNSCYALTSLDVSSFDTGNVTFMQQMFRDCRELTVLDVTNFDTTKVTNMNYMISYCYKLTSLDVSKLDTSSVTSMTYMFAGLLALEELDLSSFNTEKVTTMRLMFYDSCKLKSIDVSSFDTSNVINMNGMFGECFDLESIDVSNFDTSNVTHMGYMFGMYGKPSSLTSLDVSNFDTSDVTDMSIMFAGLTSLTTLDLSNFDTSNVTSMKNMFAVYGGSPSYAPSFSSSLTSLDVSSFDTSKVTAMSYMFKGCNSLDTLNISNFDTSQVVGVIPITGEKASSDMFIDCNALKVLQLPKAGAANLVDTKLPSPSGTYDERLCTGKWVYGTIDPYNPTGTPFAAADFGAGLTPVTPINGETIVADLELPAALTPARINKVVVDSTKIGVDFDDPDYVSGTTYTVWHRVKGAEWEVVNSRTALLGTVDQVTGLTNGITYEFKVVSSRVGFEDVASTIVPAKPQVLSAATVQPMPVVTPEQVAANAVAPIVFIVPNATMASTTPGSVTNDITIVVQPSTQMEVDQLEIKASEVIPAGVIAPSGTLVPKRFVEISPQTNLGAKIEATIDYISVSAGYPATLGETPDFSRFALYYNHNRVTYPVKRTEDVVLRTTDFFWYNTTDADPATNDTYTFKTRVFSTLMSVVGDNAAAEAVTATETVPTPASSALTIAILALIALGVTCVVGRKAGIN